MYEADVVTADGVVQSWESHVALLGADNDSLTTLVQCMDITDRTIMTRQLLDYQANLEAQVTARSRELIQAEKLASLGHIAAGLAHEINNPNNFILLNAEVLQNGFAVLQTYSSRVTVPAGLRVGGGMSLKKILAQMPEIAGDIVADTQRIDRIVRSLQEYAHPEKPEAMALFDLNHAVAEAAKLMGQTRLRRRAAGRPAVSAHAPPAQ